MFCQYHSVTQLPTERINWAMKCRIVAARHTGHRCVVIVMTTVCNSDDQRVQTLLEQERVDNSIEARIVN